MTPSPEGPPALSAESARLVGDLIMATVRAEATSQRDPRVSDDVELANASHNEAHDALRAHIGALESRAAGAA